MFTVTDLKQYLYCPRILYYHKCLPRIRPITDKMEAGHYAHDDEATREARRSLRSYGVQEAERHFNVWLESERWELRGLVDLVLAAPNGDMNRAWPVEWKLSDQIGDHWKTQLAVYGLLLEEQWGVTSDKGYLYLIPLRRAEEIAFTPRLKKRAEEALAQMNQIARDEWLPDPPKNRGKCRDCEFRRFCNDV
jgi:CRISPR-associated exonuclease Cas4